MGNKSIRLQQEAEKKVRLKGQLKDLTTTINLFEEIVDFGCNNNVEKNSIGLEDFKVAFIGYFKHKHKCTIKVKGLRTIENALWYQFMQMYNISEYNSGKKEKQKLLFVFCRFIESILVIKQLSRFIKAVLSMFIIKKDDMNISIINGILNLMIYFLRETNNEDGKARKMYRLELPSNCFATDRDDFEKYLKTKLPMLVLQLPIFVSQCIMKINQSVGYDFQYRVPKCLNSNTNSDILSLTDFHLLATTSLNFSKHTYEKLFSTKDKGFGFGNLVDSVEGYTGPTLLVIQDTFGNVFGGFTCNEWQQSKMFYGNENCFIFSVQPNFAVLSPRITNSTVNTNFQYLCSKNHHSKALHGIGFGGDPKYTRLFLSSDFKSNCTCRSTGLSFDQGSLLKCEKNKTNDDEHFVASVVEIWGFGVSKF